MEKGKKAPQFCMYIPFLLHSDPPFTWINENNNMKSFVASSFNNTLSEGQVCKEGRAVFLLQVLQHLLPGDTSSVFNEGSCYWSRSTLSADVLTVFNCFKATSPDTWLPIISFFLSIISFYLLICLSEKIYFKQLDLNHQTFNFSVWCCAYRKR